MLNKIVAYFKKNFTSTAKRKVLPKTNTIQDFENDCYLFNDIAQNDAKVTKLKIKAQLDLIKEELQETYDALEAGDPVKLLDGYCDIMVTAGGFGKQLHQLGMDIDGARQATADNNLDKFIWVGLEATDKEKAEAGIVVHKSLTALREKGVSAYSEYNETYGCFVLKNEKNKVQKPITFKSNDLTSFTKDSTSFI